MKRLSDEERMALRTVGPAGEGPVSPQTFDELERLGWGKWVGGYWEVTPQGQRALELDELARSPSGLGVA
jgi:hypothetical protein